MFVLPRTGLKNSSVTKLWLKVWTVAAAMRMSLKRAESSTHRRRMTSWSAQWASCWRLSMKDKASSPRTAETEGGGEPFILLNTRGAKCVTQRSPSYRDWTAKHLWGRRTPSDWGPDSTADAGKSSARRRPLESAAPPPSESHPVPVGSSSGDLSWVCQSLQRWSCLEQVPGQTKRPNCVLAIVIDLFEEAGGRTVNSKGSAWFSPRRRTQLGRWSQGPLGTLSSARSGKWVPQSRSPGVEPSVHSGGRRGYRADAVAGTWSMCTLWPPPKGTWWWPKSRHPRECKQL